MLHLGRRDTDRQCRAESAPEVLRTAMPVRDGEDHTCALACWRCPGYGTLRGQAVRAVGSPVDRLASHTPLRRHVFMDHYGILSASGLCQHPAVGIVDVFGEPAAPQAWYRCVRHGRPIGLLIFLPTARLYFPPGHAHDHLWSSSDSVTRDTREGAWDTLDLLVPPALVPLDDGLHCRRGAP